MEKKNTENCYEIFYDLFSICFNNEDEDDSSYY